MNDRKKPARWRKARNPLIGGRWSTPMNNFIWNRDHGNDIELWRGDVHLATARPRVGGRWEWRHELARFDGWHLCADKDSAKSEAKKAAMEAEKARS